MLGTLGHGNGNVSKTKETLYIKVGFLKKNSYSAFYVFGALPLQTVITVMTVGKVMDGRKYHERCWKRSWAVRTILDDHERSRPNVHKVFNPYRKLSFSGPWAISGSNIVDTYLEPILTCVLSILT